MAQIPTSIASRSLDPGSVVQVPTGNPIGVAVEKFGQAGADLAERFQQIQQKQEDFKATIALDGFKRSSEAKFADIVAKAPADGTGVADSVRTIADEERKTFLATVPPRLHERFNALAENAMITINGKAAEAELGASRDFQRNEISQLHNRLTGDIMANPDPAAADQVYAFGRKAIEESRLPEAEKLKRLQLWESSSRTAEAQTRWRDNTEEMAKAFGVPYRRELDREGWERALVRKESSGDPRVVNSLGYAGLYQFGAPRLAALGIYTPGAGESVNDAGSTGGWSGSKWSGSFRIAGFPEIKSLQDFLNSPGAQKAAFSSHTAMMDREIAQRGLERYIGTEVSGVPITREGIYSMMHLGGAGGAQAALEGRGNARDDNGSSVLDYARLAVHAVPGGNGDARFANLPLELRQRAVAENDVRQRKDDTSRSQQEASTYKANLDRLQNDINTGVATYENVQKARLDGWLTDPADTQRMFKAIDQRDKDIDLTRTAMNAIQSPTFVWNPFDATHKKLADRAFEWMGSDMGALETVVKKTGMVPAAAGSSIRGALASNNPQRVEAVLQTAGNLIANKNPNIFAGIDGGSEITTAALKFREYTIGRGSSAAEATRRIIEESSPEYEQKVKARIKGEDLNEIVKKNLKADDLRAAFDTSLFGLERNPQLTYSPEMRDRAMGDYESAFRDHFKQHGDVALSKNLALGDIKRSWGLTQVNGSNVIMKFPPELSPVYAGIESVGDRFAQQAVTAIKSWNGADVKRESLRIDELPNQRTGERFRRNEPPTYLLSYVDANGHVQMIPTPFFADPVMMREEQSAERSAKAQDIMDGYLVGHSARFLPPELKARRQALIDKPWTIDPAETAAANSAREAAAARLSRAERNPDRGQTDVGGVLVDVAGRAKDTVDRQAAEHLAARQARRKRRSGG